jgi:DNA-binding HxlR family transcriptional regulator
MLQLHLSELVNDGIVERLQGDEAGWCLTKRGLELGGALESLFNWGNVEMQTLVKDGN